MCTHKMNSRFLVTALLLYRGVLFGEIFIRVSNVAAFNTPTGDDDEDDYDGNNDGIANGIGCNAVRK